LAVIARQITITLLMVNLPADAAGMPQPWAIHHREHTLLLLLQVFQLKFWRNGSKPELTIRLLASWLYDSSKLPLGENSSVPETNLDDEAGYVHRNNCCNDCHVNDQSKPARVAHRKIAN